MKSTPSTQKSAGQSTPSGPRAGTTGQVWRGLGVLAGLGAGLAGYALLHEPLGIELERRTIYLPNAHGRLPRRGLRILHLSDTHFQGIRWRERAKMEQIRRLTADLEYDLLIHTGDFWHNEAGLDHLMDFMALLPRPRLGAYGVLGNHDYACYSHGDMLSRNWVKYQTQQTAFSQNGSSPSSVFAHNGDTAPVAAPLHQRRRVSWVDVMRQSWQFAQYVLNVPFELERTHYNDTKRLTSALTGRELHVLHNRAIHLQHRPGQVDGVDLHLVGVDDVSEGAPDLKRALAGIPDDATTILLSHHPDILEEPDSRRVNLILSGHTHGGQISLPWIGAAHTHSLHLSRREAAGYLRRGDTQVYISRGIGEGIPLRFRARPQITLLTVMTE